LKTEYKFIVTVYDSGQNERYGDSYFHCVVESHNTPDIIMDFCKKVLKPAVSSEQYEKEYGISLDHAMRSYYTELSVIRKGKTKLESNIIEYKVTTPYTD